MDMFTLALLTTMLSDSRFHVREAATRELTKRGEPAVAYLMASGLPPCPDASRRTRQLVQGWHSRNYARLLEKYRPLPYLDSLIGLGKIERWQYYQYRDQVYYLEDCAFLAAHPEYRYPADRRATRLWLANQITAGASWEELDRLLKVMEERSAYYDSHSVFPSVNVKVANP